MIKNSIKNWLETVAEGRSLQIVPSSRISLATDVGIIRKENQDRLGALKIEPLDGSLPFYCIAVCDGMGGMQSGGECATSALASFFSSLIQSVGQPAPARLKAATLEANADVHQQWAGKGGTTLSAILIESDGSLHISNVGDSRIYVTEKGSTGLRRVTVDDSLQDAFGGQGRELVQFIGIGSALAPHVETLPGGLEGVLVTSDGAHYFDANLFKDIVMRAGEPSRAAERILALARWLGGPDNATIAAFRVPDVVKSLHGSRSSLPTIWSGVAQLQIALSSARSSSNDDSKADVQKSAIPATVEKPTKRVSSKHKSKTGKRPQEKQQLEINIMTDGDEDVDR
jgi:serine/threonine protein phosphatase PrpC